MWEIKKLIKKGDYLYCIVLEHPKATKHGYVLHHRIIMENYLGRLLSSEEVVHHINGDKLDNRIENLELLSAKEHASMHGRTKGEKYVELQCPWCSNVFTRRHGNTHLSIPRLYSACGSVCSGKLSRYIQLNGITDEINEKLSRNVIRVYKKFMWV